MKSATINDAIVRRFDLKRLYDAAYVEDARKELEKRTQIAAGIKDGLISIEVEDHDPRRAADMANAFIEELRNLSNNLAITEAAQRRLFFETQLQQAKSNLIKAETALRASGVSEAVLKTAPQSTLEAIARLKAEITAQEVKMASLRASLTETNPQYRLSLEELSALRAELAKAERNDTSKTSGDGAGYIEKYRDFKYQETLFELMAKQYEMARLDEAREGAVIQVVDMAKPPERKSRPKRTLIAVLTTLTTFVLALFTLLIKVGVRNGSDDIDAVEKLERISELVGWRRLSRLLAAKTRR